MLIMGIQAFTLKLNTKNERRSNKIFAQRNLKNRMRIPKINSFTSFDEHNLPKIKDF